MDCEALQQRVQELEKANRILEKKLKRSESSQAELERTNDLKEALFRKAIRDLQVSQETVQKSHEILQQQAAELEQALSNLKLTQAQLIQSEKMSSLGQLVAGVAHEINNPISFIYGNLRHAQEYAEILVQMIRAYQNSSIEEIQTLSEEVDLSFVLQDFSSVLRSMSSGAERIEEIVNLLRTFSRLDEAELKSVSLHEGLESTLMILGSRLRGRVNRQEIRIVRTYGELPKIECYAGRINQVFMSLLSNAIDALDVRSQKSEPDWQPQLTIRTEIDSDWVRVGIADNGTGIPEAIQTRIFDPFFTTKPIGQGTGLGLSIAYQIITEHHRGKLNCHSVVDQGTEFLIELPLL